MEKFKAGHYIFYKRRLGDAASTDADGTIRIRLDYLFDMRELIATIVHEELHRAINLVPPEATDSDQDHYIMQRIGFD